MLLSARRYTDLAYPRYRFIPGEYPHPTAHPEGHSYHPPGTEPPRVAYKSAAQWRQSPDYLFGCDLYNHGYWWEAHETWEGLWQLTDKSGPQGHFLQTLIQVAACHLKVHMNKMEGVRSLRSSSRRHLELFLGFYPGGSYMGLDAYVWYDRVDEYYDALMAQTGGRLAHDYDRYPYIYLQE